MLNRLVWIRSVHKNVVARAALFITACLFVGCGGGGGGNGAGSSPGGGVSQSITEPFLRAAGKVKLPSGFRLIPTTLTVRTAADTAKVNADGSFSVRVLGGGPSIATVEDPKGNVVMMGYVDGAASGSPQAAGAGEISPTQCAVALIFYAIGAWDVDPSNWQTIRNLIAQAPQTSQLASTISARVTADPTSISDGDAQITSAIQQAAQAIGPPPSKSARGLAANPPASRVISETTVARTRNVSAGILIDPSASTQSGVEVLGAPDNAGVVFVNTFRRRCTAFVYETSAVDANGNSVVDVNTLPKPITVPQQGVLSTIETQFKLNPNPQSSFEIGTSNALNGLFGSLVDLSNKQGAFTAATTQELTLAQETGATLTTYRIIVVGPAFTEQDQVSASALATSGKFAQFSSQWQSSVDGLFYEELILDGAVPLFASLVFGEQAHIQLGKLNLDKAALEALQELADQIAGQPDINASARNGDYTGGLKNFAQLVADSGAVQKSLAKFLLSQVIFTGPPDIIVPQTTLFQQIESQLSRFSNWTHQRNLGTFSLGNVIGYADAVLFGVDLTVIIHDGIASFPAVAWDVTLTAPKVTLTPAAATVDLTESTVALTASIPGITNLKTFLFKWSTTGAAGSLETAAGQPLSTSPVADSQIVYVADLVKFKAGQQDTVTVQVFQASDLTHVVGTATATVTEQSTINCGTPPPPLGPDGPGLVKSGAGNPIVTLDKKSYHAGDIMTARLQIAGGNTSQESWHLDVEGANGDRTLATLLTIDGVSLGGFGTFDTGVRNLTSPGKAETHIMTFKINTPLDSNGDPTSACAGGLSKTNNILGPDVIAQVFGEDGQINYIVFFNAGP